MSVSGIGLDYKHRRLHRQIGQSRCCTQYRKGESEGWSENLNAGPDSDHAHRQTADRKLCDVDVGERRNGREFDSDTISLEILEGQLALRQYAAESATNPDQSEVVE